MATLARGAGESDVAMPHTQPRLLRHREVLLIRTAGRSCEAHLPEGVSSSILAGTLRLVMFRWRGSEQASVTSDSTAGYSTKAVVKARLCGPTLVHCDVTRSLPAASAGQYGIIGNVAMCEELMVSYSRWPRGRLRGAGKPRAGPERAGRVRSPVLYSSTTVAPQTTASAIRSAHNKYAVARLARVL